MKAKSSIPRLTSAYSVAVLLCSLGSSQPAVAQTINPLNGMPATAAAAARPGTLNLATGLIEPPPGETTPANAIQDASQTGIAVRDLMADARYDEALQRCQAFHDQYKNSNFLPMLLPDWIELGRRFPEAKTALAGIRDQDVREFIAGHSYSALFSEINAINHALQQDAATYDLFLSFRDRDPELAQQCYFYVEDLLMDRGDYQWCYDHMDPDQRFMVIRQSFTMQLDNQTRMAERNAASRQRMLDLNRQRGMTNTTAFLPPDNSAMLKRAAENNFVGNIRRLLGILVATGHATEAEKIRDQAVAILDDARLRSALTDLKQSMGNHKTQAPKNSQ